MKKRKPEDKKSPLIYNLSLSNISKVGKKLCEREKNLSVNYFFQSPLSTD